MPLLEYNLFTLISEENEMDEAALKIILAENIAKYRKNAGLTQGALAEKLNYSDKSISKWERGEGVPDVVVLTNMAEIFGVTVSDLLEDKPIPKSRATKSIRKKMIPILSAGIVWLTAAVVFFVLRILPFNITKEYLAFIVAIPATFIVFTVFACLWHGMTVRALAVSGIIWSTFLVLRLSFRTSEINFLLISAAILQVMTILWFYMRGHKGR